MTKKRSVGGLVMHFVGERCLDAVCGYQPKRGWATPDGLNVHRRECRPCVQLVMSGSPAAETEE